MNRRSLTLRRHFGRFVLVGEWREDEGSESLKGQFLICNVDLHAAVHSQKLTRDTNVQKVGLVVFKNNNILSTIAKVWLRYQC